MYKSGRADIDNKTKFAQVCFRIISKGSTRLGYFYGVEPMRKRKNITQRDMRVHFAYNDGKLYWKKPTWNSLLFGSRAGCARGDSYRTLSLNKITILEHQAIFLYHKGYIPKIIDHISDKLDSDGCKNSAIENLRDSNQSINIQKGKRIGKSGYRGVYCRKQKSNERYNAYITTGGRLRFIAGFDNAIDAANAYDKEAVMTFGEHCYLNFPKNRNKKQ